MKKMPKEMLAYVCDTDSDSGKPIFALAANVDEIPEDQDGEKVGVYVLNRTATMRVKRELQ